MLFAAFVKFLIPVIVVLPGIIAWHYFDGQLANPDQAYPALVKEVLPGAFVGFFAAVLFGAVLSSFNSLLNSSATLFGFDLFKQFFNNEATESQRVKAGKNFGLGLGLVSMTIAPFIAFAPDGLFNYIQSSLGSMSVPILAVVLIGMFTKKVPAIAAKAVMIGGVLLYLTSLLFLESSFRNGAVADATKDGTITQVETIINKGNAEKLFNPKGIIIEEKETKAIEDEKLTAEELSTIKEKTPEEILAALKKVSVIKAKAYPHFLHIMGIIFVLSIAFMLMMGKIRPQQTPYEPKITDAIDVTPWKYTIIVSIIITLLVLSTYLIF